ncbi:MAG: response regulator [Steroidobacteraceae bacterium]
MPRRSSNDEYLTTVEAARALGVSVRTVQLWVEANRLSAWKTAGGHRRIARASVDAMLAARGEHAPGIAPGPRSILVVENDPMLRDLYQAALNAWFPEATVQTTDNGCDAALLLGSQRPDLLITDIHMPGVDGLELLRRAVDTLQPAPRVVVVSTATDGEIDALGGVPPGVRLLAKPADALKLKATTSELLGLQAA